MVVIGVLGNLGDGKTLFMTWQIQRALKSGRKVYANYHVDGGMPIDKLMDIREYEHCITALDDLIGGGLDSRNSSTNQAPTYILMSARKQDNDVYFSSQVKRGVDVRLRDITNINVITWQIRFPVFGLEFRSPSGKKISSFKARYHSSIYNMYNTNEVVYQKLELQSVYDLLEDMPNKSTFSSILSGRINLGKFVCGDIYDLVKVNKVPYIDELVKRYGFKLVTNVTSLKEEV